MKLDTLWDLNMILLQMAASDWTLLIKAVQTWVESWITMNFTPIEPGQDVPMKILRGIFQI